MGKIFLMAIFLIFSLSGLASAEEIIIANLEISPYQGVQIFEFYQKDNITLQEILKRVKEEQFKRESRSYYLASPTATTSATTTITPTLTPSATPTPTPTKTPITAPLLIQPEDGIRLGYTDPAPFFQWEKVDDAKKYLLSISLSPDFDQNFTVNFEVDAPGFSLEFMIDQQIWGPVNAKLFWRVQAIDEEDNAGEWSEIWTVNKTDFLPPILLSPSYDQCYGLNDDEPIFEWHLLRGEVHHFDLELGIDPDFSPGTSVILQTTRNSIDLGDYLNKDDWKNLSLQIFWRVCAVNSQGVPSPWSEVSMLFKNILTPPALYQPANGAHIRANDPSIIYFTWSNISGALSYEIQFCIEDDFNIPLGSVYLGVNGLDLSKYLSFNEWVYFHGRYFWRVRGIDANGYPGPWSNAFYFTKTRWHRFLCYGDSITGGYGSTEYYPGGFCGYAKRLQPLLHNQYQDEEMVLYGIGGAKSALGDYEIDRLLAQYFPSHVLILFGINDLVDPGNCDPPFDCKTVEHLKSICQKSIAYGAIPILGTVLPVNPKGSFRQVNASIPYLNSQIKNMAYYAGVEVCDLHSAFMSAAPDISVLFYDWGHPNDWGYTIMANTWFNSIVY